MTRILTIAAVLGVAGAAPAQLYVVSHFATGTQPYVSPTSMAYPYGGPPGVTVAAPAFHAPVASTAYGAYATAYRYPLNVSFGSAYAPTFGYPYVGFGQPYTVGTSYPTAVSYGLAYSAGTNVPYVTAYEGTTSIPATLGIVGPEANYLGTAIDAAAVVRRPAAEELPADVARVTLEVPADAEVTWQGEATDQTGSRRVFVTPPLRGAGTYDVKVRWTRDGKTVERALSIPVQPGDRKGVLVLS
jgi:uncharacterized protein (TIGR03000 family)